MLISFVIRGRKWNCESERFYWGFISKLKCFYECKKEEFGIWTFKAKNIHRRRSYLFLSIGFEPIFVKFFLTFLFVFL